MNTETTRLLFALLRSAVCGKDLTDEEKALCNGEGLTQVASLAQKHDVLHLVAFGLQKNGITCGGELNRKLENSIFKAVCRCETQEYESKLVCEALERAEIPFVPLKGAVMREYYPESWMRTSCDIDILVRPKDLKAATAVFVKERGYTAGERATHDVAFSSPQGVAVELHFDLVEESRANDASTVLSGIWNDVVLCEKSLYRYEMTDVLFYFYHVAHMAKHFENGGCGIRPFIDLWILNHVKNGDLAARNNVLADGKLLRFAAAVERLSEVWFGDAEADELSFQMQDFIMSGGVYGSVENRVAIDKTGGGKARYILSRLFIPFDKLKRYYPILEKHGWLMPIMQVRRWFMLLKPDVRNMARREVAVKGETLEDRRAEMQSFLKNVGL